MTALFSGENATPEPCPQQEEVDTDMPHARPGGDGGEEGRGEGTENKTRDDRFFRADHVEIFPAIGAVMIMPTGRASRIVPALSAWMFFTSSR